MTQHEGIVTQYAVGGATAVLFYAEPTRTYDLDVFVTLEQRQDLPLIARRRPLRPWERPWNVTP